VARIYENGCFIVTAHGAKVLRSSFPVGSKDPFFKIANEKLAWLSSDVLLNLPKFSRDL
jgi:hypothetical protein